MLKSLAIEKKKTQLYKSMIKAHLQLQSAKSYLASLARGGSIVDKGSCNVQAALPTGRCNC